MPTPLVVHEVEDSSTIATRILTLPPDALFEAVEGVTFRYATDSARKPCTVVELRPPWKVKLPEIPLDRQRLRRIRVERFHLSQEKLAQQLAMAGDALLVPNSCSKRLVQKWERGEHATLTPVYQLALVYLLGCDVETICQAFPTTHPEQCVQQLTTLAQLAEAFLVLAEAHKNLREFNERLAAHTQVVNNAHVARQSLSAVSVSVPHSTS